MKQFFLICATIGGTILVLRLGLSLLGLGLETIDGDIGDIGATHADTDLGIGHDGHSHESNLGRIFTFQAIVSFLAFFGIGGLSALEARLAPAVAVVIGMASGFVTVSLLGFALRSLRHLNADGTVRLERSVGLGGTVYLRVPGGDSGAGKVILPIQGRTIEVVARTPGPELRAGESVVVSRALDDRTVEIVAAHAYVDKPPSLSD
jgi:hypothetical protein